MSMITKCKSCNADIMFVTTPAGKSHPLNLPAVKMWVKDQDGHIYSMTDCYTSHFATCNHPELFRKGT